MAVTDRMAVARLRHRHLSRILFASDATSWIGSEGRMKRMFQRARSWMLISALAVYAAAGQGILAQPAVGSVTMAGHFAGATSGAVAVEEAGVVWRRGRGTDDGTRDSGGSQSSSGGGSSSGSGSSAGSSGDSGSSDDRKKSSKPSGDSPVGR